MGNPVFPHAVGGVDGFVFFHFLSNKRLLLLGTLLLALFRAEGLGPSCELAAVRGLWLVSESQLGCASPCSFPGAAQCPLCPGRDQWQSPGRYSPGERVVEVKISPLSFPQRTGDVQHWSLLEQIIAMLRDVARLLSNRLLKNFVSSNRIHP